MRKLGSYAVVIALFLGLAQAACAGTLFPKVIVSVAPLKPYLDEILKGVGTSESLLRPGQEPHSFALAPSQARMLDEADIIVIPDKDMSAFLKRTLAAKPKLTVISLSELPGASPLPYAKENPWISAVKKAGKEDEDAIVDDKKASGKKTEAPVNDPHLWLDPERMAAVAAPLAEAIAAKTPENRATLANNAANLAQHLREEVLPHMQALLQPSEHNTKVSSQPEIAFITYHAAYQYFLQRFSIAHHGEIVNRPEDYLGGKTLDTLLTTAKTMRIRCIIGEQASPLVQHLAEYSHARVVILSPEQNVSRAEVDSQDWIKNDYDRLLYKTAKAFGGCL